MALVVAPGGVGVALRGARAPALGDLVVQAPADGQRDRQRDESRVNTENRRDEQQLTRPNEEDGEIHKREVCEEERRKDWEKDGTMGRKNVLSSLCQILFLNARYPVNCCSNLK